MGGELQFPTYESLGVRPLINCKGTFTIISGSVILPEVRQAMFEASQRYVHLDELMEAVGARIGELMQCEWPWSLPWWSSIPRWRRRSTSPGVRMSRPISRCAGTKASWPSVAWSWRASWQRVSRGLRSLPARTVFSVNAYMMEPGEEEILVGRLGAILAAV